MLRRRGRRKEGQTDILVTNGERAEGRVKLNEKRGKREVGGEKKEAVMAQVCEGKERQYSFSAERGLWNMAERQQQR